MLPSRSQLKTWFAPKRIAYWAQFLATLSLLPTVFFAYLSWKEANQARKDQLVYFLAEKSPRLKLSDPRLEEGELRATLENAGESTAEAVRLKLLVFAGDGKRELTQPLSRTTLEGNYIKYTISKHQKITVSLTDEKQLLALLGWQPSSLQVLEFQGSYRLRAAVTALVLIEFKGVNGTAFSSNFALELYR